MLVMLIMSFFSKNTIYSHSVPLQALSDSTPYILPAWEIKKANQLYTVEMNLSFTSLTFTSLHEAFADADIFEEGQGVVAKLTGDFYHETGRDSDGPWTESSTNAYIYVRSDKKAKYFAEIYGERLPLETDGVLNFYVREQWFAWYYTLPAMIILFIAWIWLAIVFSGKSN